MSDIKINEQTYSGVNTIVVKTPSGATTKFTEGERPAGTINITENGTHDVTNYASASVNVESGVQINLTLEALVGYWESEGAYWTFNSDYTVGLIENGVAQEVPLTFAIEGSTVTLLMNGETYATLEYNPNNCSLTFDTGAVMYRFTPSGTLEVTTNGEQFVAPYEKVNVNVPQGEGEDVTEWVKRDVVGTWEAKNFTVDDGTTYETIKIVFNDRGYSGEDDPLRYVDVYLDETKKSIFYSVENTTVLFRATASGDVISTLTYSGDTGTLIADDSKPPFKKIEISAESIFGLWDGIGYLNGYFNFRENNTYYYQGKDGDTRYWEGEFYTERNIIYMNTSGGDFYEYEYIPDEGIIYYAGSPLMKRLSIDETLEITAEGEHFVAPYKNVNVNIDFTTILNTEV